MDVCDVQSGTGAESLQRTSNQSPHGLGLSPKTSHSVYAHSTFAKVENTKLLHSDTHALCWVSSLGTGE